MENGEGKSSKHVCTKCGNPPISKDFLLNGCPCGNRLFRIVSKRKIEEEIIPKKVKKLHNDLERIEKDIAQVEILENGVFTINVDELFKNTDKEPVIIRAGGVYKLLNPSKL
ncbi:MAG: hypothetical protein ACXAEU_08770 [Candidatus Hodarchaeales archaeon]|jgi:predicted  nucleic acid-binding Zn-ribbon protein